LENDLDTEKSKSQRFEEVAVSFEKELNGLNDQLVDLRFENQRLAKFKEKEEDPEISVQVLLFA